MSRQDESVAGETRRLAYVSDPRTHAEDDGRASAEQRRLDLAMRVGVTLGVVGLLTTLVIIVLYLTGGQTPGTWAYFVALAAPLGFAIVLAALVGVALRRRRDSLRGTDQAGSQAD